MISKFSKWFLNLNELQGTLVLALPVLYVFFNACLFFSSDSPDLDRVYCANRHYTQGNELTEIDCSHRYAGIVITSERTKNDRIKGGKK